MSIDIASNSTKDKLLELIEEISSVIAKLPEDVKDYPEARKLLLAAYRKLMGALETTSESFFRLYWQPHVNAALRIVIKMGLLELIEKDNRSWMSAKELSTKTGYSHLLIVRVLRVLLSVGVLNEKGPETYESTKISRHLALAPIRDGIKHSFDVSAVSLAKLPEFLATINFQNPENCSNGAFQRAFYTQLGIFQWLKERPERLKGFNNFMSAYRGGKPLWFTFFPVQEELYQKLEKDDNTILLVDVGGRIGHNLIAFRAAFPDIRGRLILQDLPQTIKEISYIHGSIESMSHDFFTPQPIKGAKAYYLSSIFHDWPDDKCREILGQTAAAMTKGFSRLLINKYALPDGNCPVHATCMDVNMRALFASMERTRTQWQELLASAGFEVVRF